MPGCVRVEVTVVAFSWGSEMSIRIDDVEVVAQGSLANYGNTIVAPCLGVAKASRSKRATDSLGA